MTRVVKIKKTGGPEVLEIETINLGKPGAEEVLIEQKAIGLNFIDTYHRSGLYPLALPSGMGAEGSGIIKKIGSKVKDLSVVDINYPYFGGNFTNEEIKAALDKVNLDVIGITPEIYTKKFRKGAFTNPDPGTTIACLIEEATLWPSTIFAASVKSSILELVHEPIKTFSGEISEIGVPGFSPI